MCIVHVSRCRTYINNMLKKDIDIETVDHGVIMSTYSTETVNAQGLKINAEITTERITELAVLSTVTCTRWPSASAKPLATRS